jgi:adenylylsulfate kinase-like enzyme
MANPLSHAVPADPVIDRYLRDVDRTLLRRNLALSPQERLEQLQELARFAEELRRAGGKTAAARSP